MIDSENLPFGKNCAYGVVDDIGRGRINADRFFDNNPRLLGDETRARQFAGNRAEQIWAGREIEGADFGRRFSKPVSKARPALFADGVDRTIGQPGTKSFDDGRPDCARVFDQIVVDAAAKGAIAHRTARYAENTRRLAHLAIEIAAQ